MKEEIERRWRLTQKWLELAEGDHKTALFLLRESDPLNGPYIAFHAQQSAEKYLKGWLVLNGDEPPYTHDLNILLLRCKQSGAAGWPQKIHRLGSLPEAGQSLQGNVCADVRRAVF